MRLDWDALAGVFAAVAALVMHFLHVIDEEVLLVISPVLLALLFIRDLRREHSQERMEGHLQQAASALTSIQANLAPPDALLIGPRALRSESERFCREARGDMIWFHVCLLMFKPQALFDSLLRPAIDNPMVTSIQFVLDESQKGLWESEVAPKLAACERRGIVREPCWRTIDENISIIIAETGPETMSECLLSFWGEPFMAYSAEREVPRYIFRVQKHSELVARLAELERSYRFST